MATKAVKKPTTKKKPTATKRRKASNTAATTIAKRQAKEKAAMLEALRENLGNVTLACQMCHIGRRTYYDWLQADAEFAQAVETVADEAIDFAENSLMKAIKGGDTTATIFYLKTKGKKRGYTEKADIDLNGTITIECGFDE